MKKVIYRYYERFGRTHDDDEELLTNPNILQLKQCCENTSMLKDIDLDSLDIMTINDFNVKYIVNSYATSLNHVSNAFIML